MLSFAILCSSAISSFKNVEFCFIVCLSSDFYVLRLHTLKAMHFVFCFAFLQNAMGCCCSSITIDERYVGTWVGSEQNTSTSTDAKTADSEKIMVVLFLDKKGWYSLHRFKGIWQIGAWAGYFSRMDSNGTFHQEWCVLLSFVVFSCWLLFSCADLCLCVSAVVRVVSAVTVVVHAAETRAAYVSSQQHHQQRQQQQQKATRRKQQ